MSTSQDTKSIGAWLRRFVPLLLAAVLTAAGLAVILTLRAPATSLSAEADSEVVEWVARGLAGQPAILALPAGTVTTETITMGRDGMPAPALRSQSARTSVALELTGETRIRVSVAGACGLQISVAPATQGGAIGVALDGGAQTQADAPVDYELKRPDGACPSVAHFRAPLLQARYVQIGDQLAAANAPGPGETPAWSGALLNGALNAYQSAWFSKSRIVAASETLQLGDLVEIGDAEGQASGQDARIWGSLWLGGSDASRPMLRVVVHTVGEQVLLRQAGATQSYSFGASAGQALAAQPLAIIGWFIFSAAALILGLIKDQQK